MTLKDTYYEYRQTNKDDEGMHEYALKALEELKKFPPTVLDFLDNVDEDFWEVAEYESKKRRTNRNKRQKKETLTCTYVDEKMRDLCDITLRYMQNPLPKPSMAESGKPPSKIIFQYNDGSVMYYEGTDAKKWIDEVNSHVTMSSIRNGSNTFNGPQPKYDLSGMK